MTDHHRKAVIRLLRRRARARPERRRGRPIRHGLGVVGALRSTREAAGYLWSARLHSRLVLGAMGAAPPGAAAAPGTNSVASRQRPGHSSGPTSCATSRRSTKPRTRSMRGPTWSGAKRSGPQGRSFKPAASPCPPRSGRSTPRTPRPSRGAGMSLHHVSGRKCLRMQNFTFESVQDGSKWIAQTGHV